MLGIVKKNSLRFVCKEKYPVTFIRKVRFPRNVPEFLWGISPSPYNVTSKEVFDLNVTLTNGLLSKILQNTSGSLKTCMNHYSIYDQSYKIDLFMDSQ